MISGGLMRRLFILVTVAVMVCSMVVITRDTRALHRVPVLISKLNVNLDISPQSYGFSVKADIDLTPYEDVLEFELELDPSYEITALTLDGKQVPAYFSYGTIDIFTPAREDETHKLHIEYDGYAPGDPRMMNAVYVGPDMAHFVYGWLPEIPEQNYWLPRDTTLTIKAPSEWKTYCIGKEMSSSNGTTSYKLDYQSQYLTCGAGPYKTVDGYYNATPVKVYFFQNHIQLGKQYIDEIKSILEHHEKYLGLFPQTRYQLVEVSDYINGGMGPAGMTLIYSSSLNQPLEGRQRNLLAHEIGHCWTPGTILTYMGNDNSAVLTTECLVSYISYLYNESVEGRYKMVEMMTQDIGNYFSYIDRNGDTPLLYLTNANSDIRTHIAYNKGPWIYHMLRYFLGDDKFTTLISGFVDTYKGKRADAYDFWDYCVENFDEDIPQNFFLDWLARASHLDVWVSGMKETQMDDGTYSTDISFGARGGATWVNIEADIYYKEDGEDTSKRVIINDYTETVETPSPITDVVIDPRVWFPSRSNLPPTGPLSDCINRGRYSIVVFGTQGGDMAQIMVSKYWARLFYRYLQSTNSYGVDLLPDKEVTEEMLAQSDVYLFGDPSVNSVTSDISSCFPVQFGDGRFSVGGQTFSKPDEGIIYCYINKCYNTSKYVTVFAGNSANALDGCLMVDFESMGSDYVVYDELSKDSRQDSYLAKGVFGKVDFAWKDTSLPNLDIDSITEQSGNIFKINGIAPGAKYVRVGQEAIHVETDASFKGMFELDPQQLTINIEAFSDDWSSIHYNFNRFLLSPEIAINLKTQSSMVTVNKLDVSDWIAQPVKVAFKSPFISASDMATLLWMSGGTCSTYGDDGNTYIMLAYGDRKVLLTEGQSIAFVDGQPVPIDKANALVSPTYFGELYVPISVVAMLGAKYSFNTKNGDIWIKFKTGISQNIGNKINTLLLERCKL